MQNILLHEIDTGFGELFEDSESEASSDDEEYEEEEEEGDEQEDEYEEEQEQEEQERPSFRDIYFKLTDLYRFASLLTKSNSKTAVYDAVDKNTNQNVCIKIVLTNSSAVPIEVKILEHIRRKGGHENVQELIAVHHLPSIAWIVVTKFYPSTPDFETKCLFFNSEKIHLFMTQLLKGIDFLHMHSIIHRDIKPSNLLWDDSKLQLTIIDFDLATWNHTYGHCVCVGTNGYIAPEVLAFDRDVSARPKYFQSIDLYSAGCVFAGFIHSVTEDDMKEKYFHVWREKYVKLKTKDYDDELLLTLIELDTKKRITASNALKSNYVLHHSKQS